MKMTKSIDGPALSQFKKYLSINPTYQHLKNPTTNFGMADREYIGMMEYCPITSVDVERSFSTYNRLLTDLSHNLSLSNRAMYMKIMLNGVEIPKIG